MRVSLILGVLALTAMIFYTAIIVLPAANAPSASSASLIAELEGATTRIEADRVAFDAQSATLNGTIATLKAENLERKAILDTALAERDQLQSQLDATIQQLNVLEAQSNAVPAADTDGLVKQIETLKADLENREAALGDAKAALEAMKIEKVALAQQLADSTDGAAEPQTTDTQAVETKAKLDQNLAALAEAEDRIAQLTQIATAQVEKASALTTEIETREAQVTALTAEASSLAAEVARRDAIITGLMARTEDANVSLESSCQERTDAVFAAAPIIFYSGTSTIDGISMPLLEELASIASDCVLNNLTLEIEGHSGEAGGVASNLLLSAGRAEAVRDALTASGVPGSAMRSVAFGGSDPIADNETGDGQSQNQRIVFDWEQS